MSCYCTLLVSPRACKFDLIVVDMFQCSNFLPKFDYLKYDLKTFVNTYEFLLQMIRSPEMSITRI
jgi:hypothetical protein